MSNPEQAGSVPGPLRDSESGDSYHEIAFNSEADLGESYSGGSSQPQPDLAESSAPDGGTVDGGTVDSEVLEGEIVDGEILDDGAAPKGAAFGGSPEGLPTAEELVVALERTVEERDQYIDNLRRLQAEFENYRKAVRKREIDAIDRANDDLVNELLPVIDACDGAVDTGVAEVEPIRKTLVESLARKGLARLDPTGESFDPAQHEAVLHEPADGGDSPVVTEVLRIGYSWNGRVVRPAMVKVRG